MKIRLNKKRYIAIVASIILFLIIGMAIAGITHYTLSFNSPATFPVDI